MEPLDPAQHARLDPLDTFELAAHSAPDRLLPNVLARIKRLDGYARASYPASQLVDAVRDARWEVRAATIHALGECGDTAPLEPLVSALSDEHVMVRVAAVRALGRLGERAPLDRLILALRDPEWEVREAVTLTLGELDAAAARPLLVAALQDSHSAVRLAAEDALARHAKGAPVAAYATRQRPDTAARARQAARALPGTVSHYAQLLARQPTIVQRNWLVPALILFLSDSLVLVTAMHYMRSVHDTATTLTIVTTLAAAVGIAFAANVTHDPSAEIALATATSMRAILFCRFLVVIGATALVSGCASVAIALFYGQGAWGIVQLWLGPMLLAAALTLALVLVIGSWIGVLGACILEALQTLHLGASGQLQPVAHPLLWQTTPLIMLLAALCLFFAFLYAPRRLRLPQGRREW